MSADLPPKVRDRAAQAAVSEFHEYRKQYGGPNWERIADAVVAVVAPEIERPLKARIENLEAHNAEHRAQNDDLQARIEELEAALRDVINAAVGYSLGEIDGHDQLVATDTASIVLDGKGAKP